MDPAVQQAARGRCPTRPCPTRNPTQSEASARSAPMPPCRKPSATNGPRMKASGAPTSSMISISSRRACRPRRTTVATVTAAAMRHQQRQRNPCSTDGPESGATRASHSRSYRDVGHAGQRASRFTSASARPSRSASGRTRTSTDAGNGLSSNPLASDGELRELAPEARQRLGLRHVFAAAGQPALSIAPRSRRAAPTSHRRAGRPRTRRRTTTRASSRSAFHVTSSSAPSTIIASAIADDGERAGAAAAPAGSRQPWRSA